VLETRGNEWSARRSAWVRDKLEIVPGDRARKRNSVSTRQRNLMSLSTLLVLSLLFPAQQVKAAQRTSGQAQSAGAQAALTRLIVTVREEGGATFSGLATITLQHLDGPVLSTGTTMGGQTIFDSLGPGEYTIVVSAPGYLTATEQIRLTHGSDSEQAFIALKKDAGSSAVSAPHGPPALSPKLQKELGKAAEALQSNNLEEAQKHVDSAYRLAPGNPEVNYIRGLLEDRKGNLAAAQASWEKTLALDPKHGLTLQALATIMARKGDYISAQGYLERALQVESNSWHAHELLSIVCFRQANFAEAVSHAERSLELGKNAANGARLPMAESLIALNQTASAREVLQAFLGANPPQAQAAIANKLLQKLSVWASPPTAATETNPRATTRTADLPELPLLRPQLPKWLPANVDEFEPPVEAGIPCPLREVLDGAADHVREFMKSVDRITATEALDHQVVNDWGFAIHEEKRSFNYLVSISEVRPGYLSVEEYRDGTRDLSVFPDSIATTGLPAAVLVFHPYYRDDYEMRCEGLGKWKGSRAWQIHFAQKTGKPSRLRGHRGEVAGSLTPIALKGRAWIEETTNQVVRIETDLQAPMPEIKLLAEHMDIEFGPVIFHSQKENMWLPASADVYFDLRGRHIRRKNTFTNYLLFSVNEKQSIAAPKETKETENTEPHAAASARPERN
jgi:tetratricopeptide (TPR) repeat protein